MKALLKASSPLAFDWASAKIRQEQSNYLIEKGAATRNASRRLVEQVKQAQHDRTGQRQEKAG